MRQSLSTNDALSQLFQFSSLDKAR